VSGGNPLLHSSDLKNVTQASFWVQSRWLRKVLGPSLFPVQHTICLHLGRKMVSNTTFTVPTIWKEPLTIRVLTQHEILIKSKMYTVICLNSPSLIRPALHSEELPVPPPDVHKNYSCWMTSSYNEKNCFTCNKYIKYWFILGLTEN
jgi:hypothetical protein